MTLERVDQLVFGYEEGHRLLGGSTRNPGFVPRNLVGRYRRTCREFKGSTRHRFSAG